MPLIRRPPPGEPAAPNGGDLTSASPDERWRAARSLGAQSGAVAALDGALAAESDHRVREALFTSLVRIGTSASAQVLARYVSSPDANLRSGAIEALQAMGEAAAGVLPALLSDGDSDVRVRAVEIARTIAPAEATALLAEVIDADPHVNVCAAAVEVLAENGTLDAVPALEACGRRFAGDPFLPFAVRVAIARLTGAG